MNMVKVFADFRTQDLGPFTAKEKKKNRNVLSTNYFLSW